MVQVKVQVHLKSEGSNEKGIMQGDSGCLDLETTGKEIMRMGLTSTGNDKEFLMKIRRCVGNESYVLDLPPGGSAGHVDQREV